MRNRNSLVYVSLLARVLFHPAILLSPTSPPPPLPPSSHGNPGRYKTIFIGSRLDARLLGEGYEDEDFDDGRYSEGESSGEESGVDSMEAGKSGRGGSARAGGGGGGTVGGAEEAKDTRDEHDRASGRSGRSGRRWRSSRRSSPSRGGQAPSRARQESTRELVDFFAERMQEARDAWSTRVQSLQKLWQTSALRVDWGMRSGNASADRDAAMRLTFGLIVRMYAYEDALDDLKRAAEQDPSCLEAFAPQVGRGRGGGGGVLVVVDV